MGHNGARQDRHGAAEVVPVVEGREDPICAFCNTLPLALLDSPFESASVDTKGLCLVAEDDAALASCQ